MEQKIHGNELLAGQVKIAQKQIQLDKVMQRCVRLKSQLANLNTRTVRNQSDRSAESEGATKADNKKVKVVDCESHVGKSAVSDRVPTLKDVR